MRHDRYTTRIPLFLLVLFIGFLLPGLVAAQVQLESDLTLDLTVAAGESYDGPLVLRNVGDEAVSVRIYQSDYRFNAQGETFFEDPGTLARSNSDWIELPSSLVSIPAGEALSLTYRIDVPNEDNLVGSYWSLIFVEGADTQAEAEAQAGSFSLRQVVRYGIQVMTTIGQTGAVDMAFESPALRQDEPGLLAFEVDVQNAGERFVRPAFQLDLYDSDGTHAGRFDADKLRIYPGTSVRPVFDLSGVAPGSYSAIFVADAGGEHVFGARYSLEVSAP